VVNADSVRGDRRVRTLIVDDDEDMRMLATSIIRIANAGLEVVGEAEDAESGLERWRELHPDVVVLDHRMPGRSGLDVAEEILSEEPAQPIILFSAYIDTSLTEAAKRTGICSILDKDRFNDLPEAVWTCAGP
jgi:DNA-binding NarL/FixJ family response regulator